MSKIIRIAKASSVAMVGALLGGVTNAGYAMTKPEGSNPDYLLVNFMSGFAGGGVASLSSFLGAKKYPVSSAIRSVGLGYAAHLITEVTGDLGVPSFYSAAQISEASPVCSVGILTGAFVGAFATEVPVLKPYSKKHSLEVCSIK